jgi:hypothetical protein
MLCLSSSSGIRASLIGLALCFFLSLTVPVSAQQITLRSQRNPITGASQTKYADVYAEGNIAVMGTYSARGALIFDITNPDNPVLANHYNPSVPSPTTSATQQMLEALVVNQIGYFGSGNGGGVHVVNLSNPYSPVLITRINAANGGGYNTIHEIVVDGNFLYETDSRTNSLPVGPAVVKVINISNPAAPVFVRNIITTDTVFVHAIHVKNGRLFTSAWGGKTDIYDISNVGTQAPPLLGTVNTGSNSHSNWISEDGNYLYNARETLDGDLRVYNITNPAAATLVKSIKAADLGLNAICPHNPVVVGNLLFVAWYQAGIQVFNISNPADPVRIGQYDTFPAAFNRTEALERAAAEPWDLVCGLDALERGLPNTFDGNWAVYPFLGLNKVILADLATGLYIIDVTPLLPAASRTKFADFDGDGQTDLSQFRPGNASWFIQNSSNNSIDSTPFGLATDFLTPGDYDGDGKTDIAVFRPSDGTWYMLQSTGGFKAQQFGSDGDIPVAGYFDTDNKSDVAVFRPSNGTWYAMRSADGFMSRQWGSTNDKPFVGDFDGDNLADIGVYRPSVGTWYVLTSSNGSLLSRQFGASTDIPLIGDFDGDSKTDFTVFRPAEGTWYMLRSSNGGFSAQQFGINGDVPVPGDFDGDDISDLAVFRPGDAYWYLIKSSNSAFEARQFGEGTDRPVLTAYYPQ